jgi:hypothetical protein
VKKLNVIIIALLLPLWLLIAAANADDNGHKARARTSMSKSKPPDEMALLYPRIGRWKTTIRTEPSESLPKGGIDEGVMTIGKGPGGFSIVQNFHSRGSSGELRGQSYTWWDKVTKTYKSVWCDNMQGCTEFTTVINGNNWTVELDGEANGKKVHTTIRATMSDDHNTIHEEFVNSYNGGAPKKETVSTYKRITELPNK